jgi:hypothetical protein
MSQVSLALRGRNPDVLTCIANLSNDEVFTSPDFANQMLDAVAAAWSDANSGEVIWANPNVRFLDPVAKSGAFLREITTRLTAGLATEIPDLKSRVEHILTKQVFGIAVTRLTALIARRSVYCSKFANGVHSIVTGFPDEMGNIWHERTEHSWVAGRCTFCGANSATYERSKEAETYAYPFIHATDIRARIKTIFGDDVHFDVIVGNPPYQLSDGGFGISAQPIYHHFIEQAKALEPRYIAMVTPARWFTGGKGLDDFRDGMLSDDRLRVIADFPDSNDVFPGTQIKGGVAYWLWDRDNPGPVKVQTHSKGQLISEMVRPLREQGARVFIRYNEGTSILRKVMAVEQGVDPAEAVFSLPENKQFKRIVSSRRPFGFDTTFKGHDREVAGDLLLHRNGGTGFVPREDVTSGNSVIDHWKVFIPRAGSGSDAFPHPILSRPFIGAPGEVSSETYIYIGPFSDHRETSNVVTYITTRLLRFLVLLHKPSQSTTREHYTFVPLQDFSKPWTDEELYERYGLDASEIAFIESMVRPMTLTVDE